jgi:hypothetical protein
VTTRKLLPGTVLEITRSAAVTIFCADYLNGQEFIEACRERHIDGGCMAFSLARRLIHFWIVAEKWITAYQERQKTASVSLPADVRQRREAARSMLTTRGAGVDHKVVPDPLEAMSLPEMRSYLLALDVQQQLYKGDVSSNSPRKLM